MSPTISVDLNTMELLSWIAELNPQFDIHLDAEWSINILNAFGRLLIIADREKSWKKRVFY